MMLISTGRHNLFKTLLSHLSNIYPVVGLMDHMVSESFLQYFWVMSQKAELLIRLQNILKYLNL